MPLPRPSTVAVVGAGPAGLVAARELRREGHEVTVFEKSGRVGGTWGYDPRADSDPVGLDPAREVVHGSMYASLRTNVPRDLMGFSGFALADRVYAGDPRPFPGHQEVLAFLEAFAEEADVARLVRLRAEVLRLAAVGQGDTWRVTWRGKGGAVEEEVFDAVVVCSGNCTIPRVPKIQGIDKWPGKQMHSHNYRTPEPFQHQVVVIVGTGPSGVDIGTEICDVAKEVHVACRYPDGPIRKIEMIENVWKHDEQVSCVQDDGMVCFTEGSSVAADAILYCTGYEYHFPFLDADVVAVDDNRVEPLYKQVFPPKYAPSLSFIGLQRKAITFSLYELQSKWVASVLSRKAALPSEEDMLAAIDEDYRRIEENGKPKRHTHWLLTHTERVEYTNWFAGEVGAPPLEDWMYEMFENIVSGIWSVNSGPWV